MKYPRFFVGDWDSDLYLIISTPKGTSRIIRKNKIGVESWNEEECEEHVKKGAWKELPFEEAALRFSFIPEMP